MRHSTSTNSNSTEGALAAGAPEPSRKAATPQHKFDSRQLLDERGEALIVHQGREYRLRRSLRGGLVLTG